ncbi:MAG: signal peptide peptidase SppA [Mongoliibacter sp.]|uniref:signal peptide peptidase SppA n=1 Tax=Mongoliibacter sp. TaxID=2022438 RepID=UPI0012F1D104|nr:signal peptide peptidase SppA [Mongoliibacter sp.]TVP44745.1 MAG: signal peptide peptidase SppA [Mongoliibacter sp.]
MRFLGNVLAVIVGLLVFSVMSFFIFAGLIAIISTSEDDVTVKSNTVLVMDLEGRVLVERTNEDDPSFSSLSLFGGVPTVGLTNLKRAIENAKENEDVRGIYLKAGTFSAGQANMKELRDKLLEFKESGKFILSYGEFYSENGYYLSSVADEVYLNPAGLMEYNGFSSELIFFTGLFKKLEIKPEVFRVGDFKSAVEPFLLEEMSDENRLQTESFLNDLNQLAVKEVAESRGLDFERVNEINSKMLIRRVSDAVDLNMIDGLHYEDQVLDIIRQKLELEEDDKIPTINITRMNKATKSKGKSSKNRIAVIVAEGEIISGESEGSIGSDEFTKEINKARKNKDIKAIVLRINSPGGSALASEVMWREIERARKEKPVIASMGDVAASGGYYLAAAADTIVAQPNTITGSIGIFALWFNAEGLLKNKLGITTDVAKTGEYSDFLSPTRQLSDTERSIFQGYVEDGYDLFLDRVASGRDKSKEEIKTVASGRVWTGNQALENGLVDVLGNLEKAIEIAAEKAAIADDYRTVYYPQKKPWFERFMNQFSNEVQARIGYQQFGPLSPYMNELEKLKRMEGLMLRMPYDIKIK